MTTNGLKTHKPTGKPSWPILLLAGGEKCGKSYAAAVFSDSDIIDRTFWLEIGEGTADEYGTLGRYEIVDHDGTYTDMLNAVEAIAALPKGKKPHCIVVDSMTNLWALLCDEQETIRARRNKSVITMDQWNAAKKRWRSFYDALRKHDGPVILTARYERVTVVDGKGQPTDQKEWKVRAEKDLSFEVDGSIVMPTPRRFYLSGIRSLAFQVPPGGYLEIPDFTIDKLIRELGVIGNAGQRTYTAPKEDPEMPAETETVTADEIMAQTGAMFPEPAAGKASA